MTLDAVRDFMAWASSTEQQLAAADRARENSDSCVGCNQHADRCRCPTQTYDGPLCQQRPV